MRISTYICLIWLCFAVFPASSHADDHAKGQLIVMLQPRTEVTELIRAHARLGGQPTRLHVAKQLSTMNIWLLEFNPDINEIEMLNVIRQDKNVAAAQFNYTLEERTTPDDTWYPNQWNLENTGQAGGTPDADIDADSAWSITTGGLTKQGDTIVVAIVDCGFDLTQEDIDFWKNNLEVPDNGIDDDSNGYIDDYNGWSSTGSDSIQRCLHGTHVAGIAGARGNNNKGIAGINWDVKILPLDYDSLSDANVVIAYGYAYRMRKLYNETNGTKGAFIVSTNTSFGKNRGLPADHPVWCAMFDSLGSVGILSAGAGPNIPFDVDTAGDIPTTCPSDWLIGVTNTTNKDVLYTSASFGPINIDIGAPGTGIWSTIPFNTYGQQTGTSMATPHVAGAVALMWAAACEEMISDYKLHPAALASVMKKLMLQHVDSIPALQDKVGSAGRLNLHKSLLAVGEYCKRYIPIKDFSYFIYPNPASDYVSIDVPSRLATSSFAATITDMLGRTIATRPQKVSEHENYFTLELDISNLSSGMYLVNLEGVLESELFNRTKTLIKLR